MIHCDGCTLQSINTLIHSSGLRLILCSYYSRRIYDAFKFLTSSRSQGTDSNDSVGVLRKPKSETKRGAESVLDELDHRVTHLQGAALLILASDERLVKSVMLDGMCLVIVVREAERYLRMP